MSERRVSLLFFHPNPSSSRVNKRLLFECKKVHGLRVREMYDIYPQHVIDINREKAHLLEDDLTIFQHPFYWYSYPPLMKQWLDDVLEFNFAYGPQGKALHGKTWMQ